MVSDAASPAANRSAGQKEVKWSERG